MLSSISKIILILSVSFILSACKSFCKPTCSQLTNENALSNNVVDFTSYDIPSGIFRGVLWPNDNTNEFQIWIINNNKEEFMNIRAPQELDNGYEEVTEKWKINKARICNDTIIYSIERKDLTKSIKLELPLKKREYSFNVLNSVSGAEILLFMDISENIIDSGIFGFVIIK